MTFLIDTFIWPIASVADVVEGQRLRAIGAFVAHRPDQPRAAFSGQREDRNEIGLVEIDVQLAVERGSFGVDVGDVEELPVGAAGKAGADGLPHLRACAVAAGEIARLDDRVRRRRARAGVR